MTLKRIWLKTLIFAALWLSCRVRQHDDAAHAGAVNRPMSAIHEAVLIAPPVAIYAPAWSAAITRINDQHHTHQVHAPHDKLQHNTNCNITPTVQKKMYIRKNPLELYLPAMMLTPCTCARCRFRNPACSNFRSQMLQECHRTSMSCTSAQCRFRRPAILNCFSENARCMPYQHISSIECHQCNVVCLKHVLSMRMSVWFAIQYPF